jgi:O-antigen/teichoic acid export membrane protein
MTPQPAPAPRLSVQAFWLMFAKTVSFGLTVFLPMLLVRMLSQAQYGTYKQAYVAVASAIPLLGLGVAQSASYYLPRQPERRPQIVLNIFLYHLLMGGLALLLFTLYPGLLARLLGSPELARYSHLIGWIVCLSALAYYLETVCTAMQDVRYCTLFIVSSQFTRVVITLAAVLAMRSVAGLLLGAVVHAGLWTMVTVWYLHRRFGRFWQGFDFALFREQLGYSFPFGLYGILLLLQSDMHNYFVSNAFGPATFAIYAVGCFQVPLVGMISDSITSVLIPRVSLLQREGRSRQILALTAAAMRKLTLAYAPAFAFLMVAGQDLIIFFYTSTYTESTRIFRWNLCLLLLGIPLTDPIVRAYSELRVYVVWIRAGLIGLLAGTLYFGVRSMGLTGTLIALILIGVVERGAVSWRAASILGFQWKDWGLFSGIPKIGAAAGAAAAVALVVRQSLAPAYPLVLLAASGTAFVLAYAGVLLGFRLLTDEEVEMVSTHVTPVIRRARSYLTAR